MTETSEIASAFSEIGIHDDTIESIIIFPAEGRKSCKVTLTLFRHWENKRRLLQFIDCKNIKFSVDMTILFDNAPNNTWGTEASASLDETVKLIRLQKKQWNVSYQKSIDPLPKKLASASKFLLFRVFFFGGILEVVAKSYKFTNLSNRPKSVISK